MYEFAKYPDETLVVFSDIRKKENGDEYVHVSKGKPTANATKIWITKAGGCILAHNNGRIPPRELNSILEIIPIYFMKIVSKWKDNYGEIKFYC